MNILLEGCSRRSYVEIHECGDVQMVCVIEEMQRTGRDGGR